MEKSGKNEYVLTSDEVQNFTPSEIKGSFNPEMKKNFGFSFDKVGNWLYIYGYK